jgi:hypothetical protein
LNRIGQGWAAPGAMTLRSKIVSLRNFNWRSETDFDPIWEQRTYYLSRSPMSI